MRAQKYTLAILFVLFLATIVSATPTTPTVVNLNVPASGINSGQNFEVKFAINNTQATNITNITIGYVDSKSDPFAALTSVSLGSQSFQVTTVSNPTTNSYTSTLNNINIPNGSVSQEMTLTFRADSNAVAKSYSKGVSLTVTSSGSTVAINPPVSLNVNVNSISQISLSKLRDLTANQSATINVTNAGNTGLASVALTAEGAVPVTFSDNNFALNYKESRAINVTATSTSNLKFGPNTITITATESNGASAQLGLNLEKTFCKNGEVGENLTIEGFRIDTDGDEDDIWKPLNQVTVRVDVENNGDDRISNVYAELGLFDSNGRNVADDLDFDSIDDEQIKIGSIDDGDDESAVFEFTVPADFKEGSYRLAVKAYSKASGLGEDVLCADSTPDFSAGFYEDITVEKEDDDGKLIAFDRLSLSPSEATCGSRAVLNFDIINVGTEDQDQVKITLVNTELGLSLSQEIKEDLDSGDSKSLSFTFNIPDRVASKTYVLRLGAEYDYRSGSYREVTTSPAEVTLRVLCANAPNGDQSNVLITASLAQDSEAKAGSKMTVNARITNTGLNASNFVIGARDYNSWATLDSISERLVLLQPGESRSITLTFDVNEDASEGENTFTIEALSNGRTESREVAVDIEGNGGAGRPAFFDALRNNSLLWIIGLVNLVLIILIIVVAVRLSRR